MKGIVRGEDSSRPVTGCLNVELPNKTLLENHDVVTLSYQGESMRCGPVYEPLDRSRARPGQYESFHDNFNVKLILGSEGR